MGEIMPNKHHTRFSVNCGFVYRPFFGTRWDAAAVLKGRTLGIRESLPRGKDHATLSVPPQRPVHCGAVVE